MNTILSGKKLSKTDFAAIGVCVALFAYLIFAATVGFGSVDEDYYYTVPQRFLMGDRLLIDEWHVSQLSSVFQLFPFWLITTLVGSTEGIILYLRLFYLAVVLILYWFLYGRLRHYGWSGLLSAALFSAYVPMAIRVLNYYTMSVHGLTVMCALLFLGKQQKSRQVLMLAGFVFACAVICEPFLAFLYFLWCLLVLTREVANKKGSRLLENYGFFLNRRWWFWMTAGIVTAAALFFVFLLSRSPLPELIKGIPELFTDHEYGGGGSGVNVFDIGKIREALRYYGYLPPLGLIVIAGGCIVLNKTKQIDRWRRPLLLAAVLLLAAAYISAVVVASRKDIRSYGPVTVYYFYFHGVPLLLFGLVCQLLRKDKDPRLFCFWATGCLASMMIDLASDLVMGMGIAVTFAPTLITLAAVLKELRSEPAPVKEDTLKQIKQQKKQKQPKQQKTQKQQKPKKQNKALAFLSKNAAALCLAVILCWEAFGVYSLVFFNVVERMLDFNGERPPVTAVADRGPLKGVRTTEHVNEVYNDILADLDVIKENTDGPVYVTELFAYCYLYLERPVATYSAWYVEEDSEVRQTRYWELHPEKRPEYIYVPFYDVFYYLPYQERPGKENWGEEKLSFLKTVCDCDVAEGKAGYIVRVDGWRI